MILEIEEPRGYCHPTCFKINTIDADAEDFGIFDGNGEHGGDPDNYCPYMQFKTIAPQYHILTKYNITVTEFNVIANMLEELCSFGSCNQCD